MARSVYSKQNNCQHRKLQNQQPNVSVFSISLFSRFSVKSSHIISRFTDWNSHLALSEAIMPSCDVKSVNLTGTYHRDNQGILLKLMHNYDKVFARRFFVRIACRYITRNVNIDVTFVDKRQSLKACKHGLTAMGICVGRNIRYYSH